MKNLEQRSSEWHAWRRGGIGSSEAAILMGHTEHKSVQRLWAEKCGLEEPLNIVNEDMQRGIEFEDTAIELYSQEVGLIFEPLTIQHPDFSFLRASLDGANRSSGRFVEAKCPRPYIHQKTKLYGFIKPEYYCQMQHQYLTTGLDHGDFISYCVETEDLVWFHVEQNFEYQAELLDREIYFWEHVQKQIEPNYKYFSAWGMEAKSSTVF